MFYTKIDITFAQTMKKIFAILYILSISCSLGLAQGKALDKDIFYIQHQTNAYTISYPDNWTIHKAPDAPLVKFYLVSPSEGIKDKATENVNLVVENTQSLTAKQYHQESLRLLKGSMPKFKLRKKVSINENNHFIHYTALLNGLNLYLIQRYFIHEGNAYIVTFATERKKAKKYTPLGLKILNSFQLKTTNQ